MKRNQKSFFSSALALAAAASLVACGGGSEEDNAPVTPDPGAPVVGAENATACLPNAQLAAGYRHVLDYQVTETTPGQPAANGTRRDDSAVTGTVVVAGLTTTRTLQIETFDGSSSERTANYQVIDGTKLVNPRLDNLTGATVTGINTYEPATYIDFGLTAGLSHSQNYVSRSTTVSSGVSDTSAATDTVLFVGKESVTVPLGTFAGTCHFKLTTQEGGFSVVLDGWVAAGSGIPLKLVSRSAVPGGEYVRTEELTAGTVNGAAFRP